MRFTCCFLAALLLFSFCPGSAAQSEATSQAEVAFRQADRELNAVYASLLARAKRRKIIGDIKAAQRAWLDFRDKEASVRAGVTSHGGSAYHMDYLANRAELTRERTAQLRGLLRKL